MSTIRKRPTRKAWRARWTGSWRLPFPRPASWTNTGIPTVREFFVAKETVSTAAPKIVLNMSGGLVQEVFASDPAITVALVDWDTEGCDPSDNGIVEIPDGRGGTQLAHVAECPVEPLEQLAGTETEAALKAAGLALTLPADCGRAVACKIQLPCYGITLTLARENGVEEPGSGSIVSDLREPRGCRESAVQRGRRRP